MQTIARNTNWKSNKPGSDKANEAIHVFGIIHKHTILAYTVICGEYFVHSNSLNWFAHLYAVHLEREPQQRLSRDASNNTQVKCARPKPTIYCLFGVMEAVGRVADQKRTNCECGKIWWMLWPLCALPVYARPFHAECIPSSNKPASNWLHGYLNAVLGACFY